MVANSELRVSQLIDRSQSFTARLLRFTPIFPFPDEGLDCLTPVRTENDVSRLEMGFNIDLGLSQKLVQCNYYIHLVCSTS